NCEEVLGKNFWAVCPEWISSPFYQQCQRSLGQSAPIRFEQFLGLPDAWFEISLYPTSSGVTVYLQSIAERKQLESALQLDNCAQDLSSPPLASVHHQEQSWKALLDHSPDVISRLDRNLRYVYTNRAIEQVTGLRPAAFIGKTHAELGLSEQSSPRWDRTLLLAFETGEEQFLEFEFLTPFGLRVYQSRVVPEMNAQGTADYVLVVSRDVTEIKQVEKKRLQLIREQTARAEAERANRIKDEFLAVLSHELRSPLNPILGWARLLRTRPHDTTTLNRALEIIERNARIQTQLIEDLLDVSRILRGKITLKECSVDLSAIATSAIETVQLAAEAKGVVIHPCYEANVGKVLGDPDRLQQVIWNLLSNAVKFTPLGGRIEIRLEQAGSQAQITVIDNGIGIAPNFLPHVFDYFRQADSSTTRSVGGLGLGLAIVRYLVELHGGMVTAESPGEGQGARFTVKLPILNVPLNDEQQPQSPIQLSTLERIRVLVVDDEADSREFIAFVLEQQGAIAKTVESASEALQVFSQFRPDVLISDIGMPETNGYMLMRQIRALDDTHNVIAIALTAYASEDDQQQAYQAGFQRHVAKPIEPEKLVAIVANLVEQVK
ncbi:MAG TPA: ATP-binding protein, partial [Coleofasciculaceae cyanobacterium]